MRYKCVGWLARLGLTRRVTVTLFSNLGTHLRKAEGDCFLLYRNFGCFHGSLGAVEEPLSHSSLPGDNSIATLVDRTGRAHGLGEKASGTAPFACQIRRLLTVASHKGEMILHRTSAISELRTRTFTTGVAGNSGTAGRLDQGGLAAA